MNWKEISLWLFLACFKEYGGQYPYSTHDGVHSAYVAGEGCAEGAICGETQCIRRMDGTTRINSEFLGMFFDTFNFPSFSHIESKHFDTFAGDADLLVKWIDSLSDNTIILGCLRDDGVSSMTQQAWQALESIGLAKPYTVVFRVSFAIIGFKGSWPQHMTKSKTILNAKAIVSLTYVLPPSNVVVLLASNNKLNVTWEPLSSRFSDTQILYSATNTTSVEHYNETVRSSSKLATIGPLKPDYWYNVSMKVSLAGNETHVIVPSKPLWLIVENRTLGCSRGYYRFVLKVDGRKSTFDYDSKYWGTDNLLVAEAGESSGFDDIECKPSSFVKTKIKKICAGMRDLVTNHLGFTEIQLPEEQSMDNFQGRTVPVHKSTNVWNRLLPKGIPPLTQMCNDGFKGSSGSRKFRFGFSSGTGACSNPKSLAGYGLKINSQNIASGVTYKESGSSRTSRTFGYLLVPYFVDAEWLSWGPWGACNKTCGDGTRNRYRYSTRHFAEGLILPPYEINSVFCKIQDCTPPAPGNAKASAVSSTMLKLQWDKIPAYLLTNTQKNYNISIVKPDGIEYATSSVESKYFYNMKPYTEYCFQVSLVLSSDVQGDWSNVTCARTHEHIPLDPPTNISGSNLTAWCILVTWSPIPPERAQGIVTKYEINYWKQGTTNVQTIIPTSNSSDEICGLEPYTAYSLTMSGYTRIGKGPVSDPLIGVWTDEYIPSQAPSILSTEHMNSTSINVKWQSLPLQYWNGIPRGYTVYYVLKDMYTVSETLTNISSALASYPATEIELAQLKKYRFYIIWINAFTIKGNGINSTVKEQRTDEDTPMRGPVAKAHNSSSFSIIANWTQLEDQYRLGILLKYRVFCTNLKTKTEKFLDVDAAKTSVEIRDLLPFQNHSVEIAGMTSKGVGIRGPTSFTFTEEYKPSLAPPNFIGINISSYAVQLNWSLIPNDFRLGNILGYKILYKKTSLKSDDWNVTYVYGEATLYANIHNLTAYTDHTIRIAGFTKIGNGTFSNDIVVRTEEDAPYESPRGLNLTEMYVTRAKIKWAAPRSSQVRGIIRGYKIMYSAVYTPTDFTSHLLVRKRRQKRSVISKNVDLKQYNVTIGSNQFHMELHNLQGGTNYSVQILAFTIFEGVVSEPLYIFTKESVPAMSPINVTAYNTTYTSLMVEWKHIFPAYAHGDIQGFLVFYQLGNHSQAVTFNESQVAQRTFLELPHLNIFAWYTIQVAAYTNIGIGVKSKPVYARTDEWIPSTAPDNVTIKSFMMPYEVDIKWNSLEYRFWNGFPLGYLIVATTISRAGVDIELSKRLKYSARVDHHVNKYTFRNAKPYYKYGIEISAYTKKGNGPQSAMKFVETCHVPKRVLHSSWIDSVSLIQKDPTTGSTVGFLPSMLLDMLKHCSGKCHKLNIKNNATIDFMKDGVGRQARKQNLAELTSTMSNDTELIFPVIKPSFPNENYKYIELIPKSKVALVEGKPLVNLIGLNVSKSLSGLLAMLLIFVLFCWLAGCCVWLLERLRNPQEIRIRPFPGIFDGFYWAFVTASTVGYGDISPSSFFGRIFSMIWSLIGLILVGFLSGSLSSFLSSTDESLVKSTTVPKSGLGMVRDSWEFLTAKKKGIKVDRNYSDYFTLLNEVAKGKIRYGLMDKDIASIWAAKFVQDSISLKKLIDLNAGIGMFLTGDARQLAQCFSKHIKEEKAMLLKEEAKAIEIENNRVNKLLKVAKNVTLSITVKEPEFYSWSSQVMQGYIKIGASLLGAALVIGSIFEVSRLIRKRRKNECRIKPVFDSGRDQDEGPFNDWNTRTRSYEQEPNRCPAQNSSDLSDQPSSSNLNSILSASFTIASSLLSVPPNAIGNKTMEEETSLMIEELVKNMEDITNKLDNKHIHERLRLQRLKWDLYGTYKYIDPTDYGVPFE